MKFLIIFLLFFGTANAFESVPRHNGGWFYSDGTYSTPRHNGGYFYRNDKSLKQEELERIINEAKNRPYK